MIYRYSDGFDCANDCAWSELYGDKRRINFLKWRLFEEQLATELTEDEFCFLCRYTARSENKHISGQGLAVDVASLKNLLIKYRAWRDEASRLF